MTDLDVLKARMKALGVRRLLMKRLRPNDNSKNQVYLGGDLGVANIIPAQPPKAKTTGSYATPIFNARMTFSWLDGEGQAHLAPGAQLILYPQYPEVRFSGFLRGAEWSPTDVMTSREEGRVLLMGIAADDHVYGFAGFAEHPVARALSALHDPDPRGVLFRVPLPGESTDSRTQLLRALCRISSAGWIEPWRLQADGSRAACRGTNCVGVTLESELGICANGRAEPDFEGWEVKSHTVTDLTRPYSGILTLMTPEPTGGYYAEAGAEAFVRRFGYADLRGREDRLNFGGIHRVGQVLARTGLRLELHGFDVTSGKLAKAEGKLALLDARDIEAASWSFEGLLAHWTRKHAKAAYVPAEKRDGEVTAYRYGSRITCSVGTDYNLLLSALASGRVYLDPGIKVENASTVPRLKRRNQFRVRFADLGFLYHSTYEMQACD